MLKPASPHNAAKGSFCEERTPARSRWRDLVHPADHSLHSLFYRAPVFKVVTLPPYFAAVVACRMDSRSDATLETSNATAAPDRRMTGRHQPVVQYRRE